MWELGPDLDDPLLSCPSPTCAVASRTGQPCDEHREEWEGRLRSRQFFEVGGARWAPHWIIDARRALAA